MSCFVTGDPDKEYGTNNPPPTRRVWERSVYFPESLSLASILAERCVHHQERLWIRMIGQSPETNPITIKPNTASHMAELFSWVLLPYCSPPGCPFPIKSLALSAHVSPQTIHFRVLDKSPVSGPGRGPPSSNSHRNQTKVNKMMRITDLHTNN